MPVIRLRSRATLLAIAIAVLAAANAFPPAALAQAYPSKSIRIIVPFPPGGIADLMSRVFAQKFTEAWNQPAVVENRTGAGGNIGADAVAKSPPDGYTLVMGSIGTHAVNVSLFAKMPYDSPADFTPITPLAMATMLMVVHPALPARNLKSLVTLAKSQPGKLDFALAGPGGVTHMVLELFKSTAGVQIQSIIYKGAAPAHTDALAGHVQGMIEALPALYPTVKQGKLRAVAVTSSDRVSLLPDVGTAEEQGVKGLLAVNWFGIVAPARLPRPVLEKLHGALIKLPMQTDVKGRFSALGLEPMTSTPEAYTAMIKSDIARWGKVAVMAGVKPQ